MYAAYVGEQADIGKHAYVREHAGHVVGETNSSMHMCEVYMEGVDIGNLNIHTYSENSAQKNFCCLVVYVILWYLLKIPGEKMFNYYHDRYIYMSLCLRVCHAMPQCVCDDLQEVDIIASKDPDCANNGHIDVDGTVHNAPHSFIPRFRLRLLQWWSFQRIGINAIP